MLQPHVLYIYIYIYNKSMKQKKFIFLIISDLNSIITNMMIIKYLYNC
jgi:hypothetical protein